MFKKYTKEQPIASRILTNSIINNKLSHAYIFETNNYYDSYEMILTFVKNIFCNKREDAAHDEITCQICSQINTNNYIEFKVVDTDKLQLKKEELLKLQDEFKNKAINGNKKVYLIKCAEKLNEASSNTILKFLEEPEENIIAILMVPSRYMLLNTILSRCQIISLLNNNIKTNIIDYILSLGDFNLESEEQKIKYALDKVKLTIDFIDYFEKHKKDTLLFTKNLIFKEITLREELLIFFEITKLFYYDCLNYKTKENIIYFNDYKEIILNTIRKNTLAQIAKKLQLIEHAIEKVKLNVNLNLVVDKFIIESEGV